MEKNQTVPGNISRREFIKRYAGNSFYKTLRLIGIIGYVMFAVLFVVSIWLPVNPLERFICLGLTLGIHLGKSRICAGILLGFGFLVTVVGFLVLGRLDLVGITALGISIAALALFRKAFRQYESIKNQQNFDMQV